MIALNDRYFIGSNELNIILYEKLTTKKGKEQQSVLGYYNSLHAVLRAIVDKGIVECVPEGLEGLKQGVARLEAMIDNLPDIKISDLRKEEVK